MAYTQKNNPFKKITNPTDSDKKNYVTKMENRAEAVDIASEIIKDAGGLLGRNVNPYNIKQKLFGSTESVNISGDKTYPEGAREIPRNAYGPVDRLMQMDKKDIDAFQNNISDAINEFEGLNFKKEPHKVILKASNLNMKPFKQYLEKANIDTDELSDIIAAQLKQNKNIPDSGLGRGFLNKAIKFKLNQLE